MNDSCRIFMAAVFFCLAYHVSSKANETAEEFSEELFINSLKSGHLYLHFKFVSTTPLMSHYAHTDFFPKPVIDILQKNSVNEFHVRLTQGVFRHYKWGYPILSAPSGGEVWAWFKEDTQNIEEKWKGLTNSLAGLLCATFNEIQTSNSISPNWNFRPEGLSRPNSVSNSSLLRYSMLPRENLCTENLTPWKKLLPCSDRAGLGRLLNAIKLLSSHYFSLSLDVKPVCADVACLTKKQEIQITATAVVAPGSLLDSNQLSWSIRDLLEVELDAGCPLAQKSVVYVDQSNQGEMVFWPSATSFLAETKNRLAVYDLRDNNTWVKGRGLGGKAVSQLEFGQEKKPIISAHRFVSGYGQQNGGIRCLIENSDEKSSIRISYLEMIPWFLRVYFHTIRVNGKNGEKIPILKSHFVPGRDRQFPHQIELIFDLPPQSSVEFSVDFDFTLLKWTEYPPDANHGFTVPPAVISAKLHRQVGSNSDRHFGSNSDQCEDFIFSSNFSQLNFQKTKEKETFCFLRFYTEPLLVNLPTPDFSMPYNVICMTCTVLALAFGPIHALTTKNFKLIDPTKNPSVSENLKIKLKNLFARFKKQATVAPLQSDTAEQSEEPNDLHSNFDENE